MQPKTPPETTGPEGGFDFSRLKIRSPYTEFEEYARQKVRVAERLGQTDVVEIYLEAFDLGRELLSRKLGEP